MKNYIHIFGVIIGFVIINLWGMWVSYGITMHVDEVNTGYVDQYLQSYTVDFWAWCIVSIAVSVFLLRMLANVFLHKYGPILLYFGYTVVTLFLVFFVSDQFLLVSTPVFIAMSPLFDSYLAVVSQNIVFDMLLWMYIPIVVILYILSMRYINI